MDVCIYCGTTGHITNDHIPPKLLLERPYPENLLTVPACFPCNQSFQKDDEYTRAILCSDVRARENTAAQFNLSAVLRSLERPSAIGFKQYLASQTQPSKVLNFQGFPLGTVTEVGNQRVNGVRGARLIKALYYAETGAPISAESTIKVAGKTGLRPSDEATKTIALIMHNLPDWREKSFGTAFSYLGGLGPLFSVWLLGLYGFFFWCGTIDYHLPASEKPSAQRNN